MTTIQDPFPAPPIDPGRVSDACLALEAWKLGYASVAETRALLAEYEESLRTTEARLAELGLLGFLTGQQPVPVAERTPQCAPQPTQEPQETAPALLRTPSPKIDIGAEVQAAVETGFLSVCTPVEMPMSPEAEPETAPAPGRTCPGINDVPCGRPVTPASTTGLCQTCASRANLIRRGRCKPEKAPKAKASSSAAARLQPCPGYPEGTTECGKIVDLRWSKSGFCRACSNRNNATLRKNSRLALANLEQQQGVSAPSTVAAPETPDAPENISLLPVEEWVVDAVPVPQIHSLSEGQQKAVRAAISCGIRDRMMNDQGVFQVIDRDGDGFYMLPHPPQHVPIEPEKMVCACIRQGNDWHLITEEGAVGVLVGRGQFK
jgi:hypothetical protein